MSHKRTSLADVAVHRSIESTTRLKKAFFFLNEAGAEDSSLTYGELHERANSLASVISARVVRGSRVALMFPPGLEFIVALLACFYASAIAVPVNPPRRNQKMARLLDVLMDSEAELIVCTPGVHEHCALESIELQAYKGRWLIVSECESGPPLHTDCPSFDAEQIAFLQYTSGSTGSPKGVMISHGNLMHNSELIRRSFVLTRESRIVTWLPMFHDMGLIGNVLQTLYAGGSCVIMAPATFLRRPALWLKVISDYKATHAGAPNFGYEHCLRRIDDADIARVDLSGWKVAFCGAEPIRKQTFERFESRFSRYGFSATAFMPTYGLAESTLAVTSLAHNKAPVYDWVARSVDAELADRVGSPGSGKATASCGAPGLDTTVLIVDPQKHSTCRDEEVGEIWVQGPGVARGYWNRPEETHQAFEAYTSDTARGPFLRTGDLGYLKHGELYIAGRCSDLIIIRGCNYHPHDLEASVEESDPAFAHGGSVAFSVQSDTAEHLVILQELARSALRSSDKAQWAASIQRALGQQFGLKADAIVFLKPGKVMKTSSGKTQRRACKSAFLKGELEGIVEVVAGSLALGAAAAPVALTADRGDMESQQQIGQKLRAAAARYLKRDAATLSIEQPLADFGMDSLVATDIALQIEDMFGVQISPMHLYDYPSIQSLAEFVWRQRVKQTSVFPVEPPADGTSQDSQVPPTSAVASDQCSAQDIAIIGMAGKFPGASDLQQFWQNLLDGKDCVTEVPPERWSLVDFFDADRTAVSRSYSKWGGLLDGVDEFDPQFFNISPREAELIDPQQRLFLEQAWLALENAGYSDQAISGKNCSVFVGCSDGDYRNLIEWAGLPASAYTLMGNAGSILAARIAYFLNLKGICTTVDTACSSSLVAVHLACENLRSGQSELAIAGGVCVLSTPQFHVLASQAGMLSPTGRCMTFDQRADGFVPGEAVGVIVLKRLDQALQDGDFVHAVIKGSGANQDGRTNGITAPNSLSQMQLESSVYERFGIDARQIGYVEAHGTGTALGDPIEVTALTQAFASRTSDRQFCAIGSVKTNIGHTLAAAGVAGLIKAALVVREGQIPASLHCEHINAHVRFADTPFFPATRRCEWPAAQGLRMAAVSSFGFSGTNAHVVLASAPQLPHSTNAGNTAAHPAHIVVLSARDPVALRQRVLDLKHWVEEEADRHTLADIAFTLAVRRSHFEHRVALVVKSVRELTEDLAAMSASLKPSAPASSGDLLSSEPLERLIQALSDANVSDYADKLRALAAHYVSGGTVSWAALFREPCYSHPPLPPYPFSRERYWVRASTGKVVPRTESAAPSGDPDRFETSHSEISAMPAVAADIPTEDELPQRLRADLIEAVSQVLKLDVGRISLQADIRDFGFDSINITELTQQLNTRFGLTVTPPQLFEHQTLNSLLSSLLEAHRDAIVASYRQAPANLVSVRADRLEAPQSSESAPSRASAGGTEPIAIVGISGMMPGAENLDAFWQRLMAGDDLICEVPPDRWDWRSHYGSAREKLGQTQVKWGGFMPHVDEFDAAFFGISRREANLMDPQQRLFLQAAWHAVEDAGYRPEDLSGTLTGVFVGIFTADYNELLIDSGNVKEAHAITGLAHSILPNRLSYLLNLRGPSVPVDTACSSSLVALHQAVESIRSGSAEMAIVGGVNVMASPTPFMSASRAGMICDDGRCKTFDQRANGYARGEGVGAVLIKPLSKALADHDHIYALIRGTAVNHGGAANSLTSPNPEAQSDVIQRAMKQAGVAPDRVTYIEAHGTGTSLGDPIEINGLKKAYRQLHEAAGVPVLPNHCAVGTVKTHIGHLEAAAGIAGLTKVVLSLQHGKLHGNIHLQEPNPYIDLRDSPFYLITQTQDWLPVRGENGEPLARIAGISSFGFGGANAHVVVEEWMQRPLAASAASAPEPQLIALSARSNEQLTAAARQLSEHLRARLDSVSLQDVSFTLLCGRQAMSHRLVLTCRDQDELIRLLSEFSATGQARGIRAAVISEPPGNPGEGVSQAHVESLIQSRELDRLADLWLQGMHIPWQHVFRDRAVHRLALPGYPFARTRHWITESAKEAPHKHPLIAKVTQQGAQSTVTSTLDADAYYFADHVVAGRKVLSAAAIIEMMRAAAAQVLQTSIARLTDLRWIAPVGADSQPTELKLFVTPDSSKNQRWQLKLQRAQRNGEARSASEGCVELSDARPREQRLDVQLISGRVKRSDDVRRIYESFDDAGLCYGPGFQALHDLKSNAEESLARLILPLHLQDDLSAYVLHPSLLDGAFQAVVGVIQSRLREKSPGLFVPYSIRSVEIHDRLPARCIVHTRLCSTSQGKDTWRFDIDVADESGRILFVVRELELREMRLRSAKPKLAAPAARTSDAQAGLHYWRAEWIAEGLQADAGSAHARGTILLFTRETQAVESLRRTAPQAAIVQVAPHDRFEIFSDHHYGMRADAPEDYERLFSVLGQRAGVEVSVLHRWILDEERRSPVASDLYETLERRLTIGVRSVFLLCKAIASHPRSSQYRLLVCTSGAGDEPVAEYAAVAGLLKCAALENNKLNARMLEVDARSFTENSLHEELFDARPWPVEVRRTPQGRRIRQVVSHETHAKLSEQPPLRQEGVYWITGGLGGIGLIVARYLAEHYHARIFITGRRAADAQIHEAIAQLNALGGRGAYFQADVSDLRAMREAMSALRRDFGALHGVLHGAGVLRDGFIQKQSLGDLDSVLLPKTRGLMCLDEATANESLDFLVTFSSVTAVNGNIAQSNYAAANAFMDSFVHVRNVRVRQGLRRGFSLSINWPLWAEGGMRIPDTVQRMVKTLTGIETLSTADGLRALQTVLGEKVEQLVVATGDRAKIDSFLRVRTSAAPSAAALVPATVEAATAASPPVTSAHKVNDSSPPPARSVDLELIRRKTEVFLIELIAPAVGLATEAVEPRTPFQNLGVDSFIVLQLINDLEKDFGTLPKTLLFENFCVADLVQYFVENHLDTLRARFGMSEPRQSLVAVGGIDATANDESVVAEQTPVTMLETALDRAAPDIVQAVNELVARFGAESTAIGRGNFAPYIFLGAQRKGMLYFNQTPRLLVTFGYLGPAEYLPTLLQEVEEHCSRLGLQLNVIDNEDVLTLRRGVYSATAFAILQRVTDLQAFALSGQAMRRLRYQIGNYEKTGAARTVEYTIGTRPQTDQSILDVIKRWCQQKVMVNPYVERLVDDIEQQQLDSRYRVFLTTLDEALQSVIIISPMTSHQGYLMDCEFYTDDMPLGGLEFAIVQIIERLRTEGLSMFSLGITWGAQLADAGCADPAAQKTLQQLAERGVFDGRGNMQFKNKFRPKNTPIYLYQKLDDPQDRVLSIILMIANSKTPQSGEETEVAEGATDAKPHVQVAKTVPDRRQVLEVAGFNPANIPAAEVEFDLATDSWAKLQRSWIDPVNAAPNTPVVGIDDRLRVLFPFAFLLCVSSGQAAEQCLWHSLQRPGKRVLQNLMFPSFLYSQINAGYTPEEIPQKPFSQMSVDDAFKANLDLDRLRQELSDSADGISAVCVEAFDNASASAVQLENLLAIRALASQFEVPLIIDATRILENSAINAGKDADVSRLCEVTRKTSSLANVITASLSKDFGGQAGGLLATNDFALFARMKAFATREKLLLSPQYLTAIDAALADPNQLWRRIQQRMDHVQRLGDALRRRSIPIMQPVGGHCVLVNVRAIPTFASLAYPQAAFLNHLYLHSGVRGGIHCTGASRNSPLDGMVRLAVPVGMPDEHVDAMLQRIGALDTIEAGVADLQLVSKPNGFAGDVKARYQPKQTTTVTLRSASDQSGPPADRSASADDIAIVGVAGRYPQADNVREFWANLLSGRDCIEQRPLARWGELLPAGLKGIPETRWGGFINDIDKFDSMFFGISPKEVALLDPQERLFMEVAWETLEDAGYTPDALAEQDPQRKVGVYVGAVWQLYQLLGAEQTQLGNLQTPNSLMWSIANRVSAFMNFAGPSLTVDTACSGSLASIHLACQAIRSGECSAAIAGGVNFDLHASKWLLTAAGGFLSQHGRCKAFGNDASGYVAGEGIGAVLLKPLGKALADGDNIHGVIKACTFNHGGRASGYAVPNPIAQAELIAAAIKASDIDIRTLNYVETHGTGTKLGDPVEVQGLALAFRRFTDQQQFCALGSVKSNIGHLEAAAGIAGLTKVLLQMRHQKLVPSLHAAELNTLIDFKSSPFFVQQQVQPWTRVSVEGSPQPLRAGLSSFGAGGSNLHLIVEEPPLRAPTIHVPAGKQLFPLSARTEDQLQTSAGRLLEFLSDEPGAALHDIAMTLQTGRQSMTWRAAVVAGNTAELCEALSAIRDGNKVGSNFVFGSSRDSKEFAKVFEAGEIETSARTWVANGNLEKIAQAWAHGLLSDLKVLSGHSHGQRISLPTYPFAKVSHWIKRVEPTILPAAAATSRIQALHPLIDANESNFDRVLYRKTIDPRQFIIADHIVAGHPTLPGVAYIEMLCAAHRIASGEPPRLIRNLIWAAPISADMKSDIAIRLIRNQEFVACEITTEQADRAPLMHAQGKLYGHGHPHGVVTIPEALDLNALRGRFNKHTSREQCYALLSQLKFSYGDRMRAIAGVEHDAESSLTRLVIPESLRSDFAKFHIHPSLMDGAIQSVIALVQNDGDGTDQHTPYVPFVVNEVHLFKPLTPVCYAYIKRLRGSRELSSIKKFDVTLVDERGQVLLFMKEFTFKAFSWEEIATALTQAQSNPPPPVRQAAVAVVSEANEIVYLESVWE